MRASCVCVCVHACVHACARACMRAGGRAVPCRAVRYRTVRCGAVRNRAVRAVRASVCDCGLNLGGLDVTLVLNTVHRTERTYGTQAYDPPTSPLLVPCSLSCLTRVVVFKNVFFKPKMLKIIGDYN